MPAAPRTQEERPLRDVEDAGSGHRGRDHRWNVPVGRLASRPVAGRQGWDRAPHPPRRRARLPRCRARLPRRRTRLPRCRTRLPRRRTRPPRRRTRPPRRRTRPPRRRTRPPRRRTRPPRRRTRPPRRRTRPPRRRYGFRRHRSGVRLVLAWHGRASGRTRARYRLGAARPMVGRASARWCDRSAAAIDRRHPHGRRHDGICRRRPEGQAIELRRLVRSPRRLDVRSEKPITAGRSPSDRPNQATPTG